MTESYLLSE